MELGWGGFDRAKLDMIRIPFRFHEVVCVQKVLGAYSSLSWLARPWMSYFTASSAKSPASFPGLRQFPLHKLSHGLVSKVTCARPRIER